MVRSTGRRQLLKVSGSLATTGLVAGCVGMLGSTETVRVATAVTGIEEFNEQFEADTGIEYEQYRSDASKIATRIIQEYNADKLGFDYRRGSDPSTTIAMNEAGVFEDVPEDIRERWPDRVRFDGKLIADWMGLKLTLLYNEDMVSSPPESLEELASEFDGRYSVDTRDEFIWVALRDRHGTAKSEELVEKLGEGARWSDSHYAPLKDIVSEEYPMALTYNKFKYYDDFSDVVAEKELRDLPKIVRQISSAILEDPDNRAAAERYMEYCQENVHDFLQGTGRPDAYFDPSDVIGNDEFFIWDSETVRDLDLEAESARWQELTGLDG